MTATEPNYSSKISNCANVWLNFQLCSRQSLQILPQLWILLTSMMPFPTKEIDAFGKKQKTGVGEHSTMQRLQHEERQNNMHVGFKERRVNWRLLHGHLWIWSKISLEDLMEFWKHSGLFFFFMAVMRQRRCHQRLKSVTDCDCSAYNYFKTIESKVGSRILAELGIDIPGDIRTIKVSLT